MKKQWKEEKKVRPELLGVGGRGIYRVRKRRKIQGDKRSERETTLNTTRGKCGQGRKERKWSDRKERKDQELKGREKTRHFDK